MAGAESGSRSASVFRFRERSSSKSSTAARTRPSARVNVNAANAASPRASRSIRPLVSPPWCRSSRAGTVTQKAVPAALDPAAEALDPLGCSAQR